MHLGPDDPISLLQEREGVQPPRQDVLCQIFGSQFEVIFLLHYPVTSVSDCFCYSMGVTDGLLHLSLFLELVLHFPSVSEFSVYSMEEEAFCSEN